MSFNRVQTFIVAFHVNSSNADVILLKYLMQLWLIISPFILQLASGKASLAFSGATSLILTCLIKFYRAEKNALKTACIVVSSNIIFVLQP